MTTTTQQQHPSAATLAAILDSIIEDLDNMGIGDDSVAVDGADAVEYLTLLREELIIMRGGPAGPRWMAEPKS